ncbi:MAG: beta-propeller domain-containing protein [Ruminococcus sp.]|nr:beta-propeller domain-containing protein [Ruminococcus sp.]
MNNNEILNNIYNDSERIEPTARLNPESIENSLKGVKRKSKKGVVGSCVTLGLACVCTGAIVLSQVANPAAASYDDIYKKVEVIKKENETTLLDKFSGILNGYSDDKYAYFDIEESFDSVQTNSATDSLTMGTADKHSTTNVQVEGVDEADVVKTDGKYIFSVSDNEIFIVDSNNGDPQLITSIEIEYTVNDIYIGANKLVVVAEANSNTEHYYEDVAYYTGLNIDTDTVLLIYNLTDIANPEKVSELTQSGNCISTRKIGDVVYLTTTYYVYDYESIKKEKPETYCPVYSENGTKECMPADSIITCGEIASIEYLTVASVDLNKPEEFADMCSVLGGGSDIYASHNNIYVTSYCQIDSQSGTEIIRLSIDGTEIEENGSLSVKGHILNQFSMDEHDGYFRIVTEFFPTFVTNDSASVDLNESSTTLYVYDKNLELVGQTDAVGQGEDVKSVRFDGDIAYFVTFIQTDPVFAVDLSDPTNPKVLSELKIPGFSEYLHVMSEDLLLGFGREADPMTGRSEGLKLSMFDISDKTNVTEKTTLVFTAAPTYSEAEHNHKAVYIDLENKIIGVPYTYYGNKGNSYMYAVFKYDEAKNEFVCLKEIEVGNSYYVDDSDSPDATSFSRGMRIGNYFHIVTENDIITFDYTDFNKISSLELK